LAAEKKKRKAAGDGQASEPKFCKEQIATSGRYRDQRDLVCALLDDGETYTHETVDRLIEQYKKGLVK